MDVTDSVEEERRSQQALAQALASAERANKAKSEFLSNVSHDIRTPMNAIIGMTHIALDSGEDMAQIKDCLQKIDVSGKHLLGLINNVLDMSKIEAGKMVLSREPVHLKRLVDNIVASVQPLVAAKEHELVVDLAQLKATDIYSDGLRLSQVLLNLVSNAVKYTPHGGRICLSLSDSASPKGEQFVRLCFRVKDNGRSCLEKFMQSPVGYYDAVLMDVRMPEMNGYEATQALRQLKRADAGLPIVAMTADAFAEDMENCLRAGMNAHLPKPIDVDKLLNILKELCVK